MKLAAFVLIYSASLAAAQAPFTPSPLLAKGPPISTAISQPFIQAPEGIILTSSLTGEKRIMLDPKLVEETTKALEVLSSELERATLPSVQSFSLHPIGTLTGTIHDGRTDLEKKRDEARAAAMRAESARLEFEEAEKREADLKKAKRVLAEWQKRLAESKGTK
jgi:hypothetical protein